MNDEVEDWNGRRVECWLAPHEAPVILKAIESRDVRSPGLERARLILSAAIDEQKKTKTSRVMFHLDQTEYEGYREVDYPGAKFDFNEPSTTQ